MKLEWELIEDGFDGTTHIRIMTEQAVMPGKGWLIRTTFYTPRNITPCVVFVAAPGGAGEGLFEPISP